jgi:hypothetical protein
VEGTEPGTEHADFHLPPHWLRLGGERRKNEADSENDREPDHPHGAPRWTMAGGESSRCEFQGLPRRPLRREEGREHTAPDRANHAVGLAVAPDAVHKYVP